MSLLVDTQVLLWFLAGDPRLSLTAREYIEKTGNIPVVSIASIWEIAIKISIGRLRIDEPLAEFIAGHILGSGFQLLSITPEHIIRTTSLPFHHRDPFDRMLVAQAITEDIPMLSYDSVLRKYPIQLLW